MPYRSAVAFSSSIHSVSGDSRGHILTRGVKGFGIALSLAMVLACFATGCGTSGASSGTSGILVNVTGTFSTVAAGGAPITLTATVTGGSGSLGVMWSLTVANTACSPACGTLKASNLTAVYTPPTTVPVNQEATITARSVADNRQVFVFNFQIFPPISVKITNKFSSQTASGPVTDISATISNDITNAGLTWTLTAGSTSCAPACGTLTADPAPALTAHYQPSPTPPSGANASPTITATSVADPSKSDSFSFTIGAPPISVTILNKFSSQAVGGSAITVNATAANDFTNAGLSWTLTAGGAACSPACGSLVPSAAPSLSAVYTPPTVLPVGANASPTITATSVADAAKSDSFSFTIVAASSLFMGSYALLARGFDSAGNPMAMAGSLSSNGSGGINGGELDINDNGIVTAVPSPLAGSYTIDTSFNGVPRVTISITVPSGTRVLKCALSSDGKRAKVIEFDGTFSLNAGTLLKQDPATLTAANPAGSYAFGVDSDAGLNLGVSGRIVEAGRFVLGAGGTSVSGGVADAGQAGALNAVFGGPSGAALLDVASSSATGPDSSGRGTLTLSFAGNVTKYAYYIVSAQQINLIEIDTGGSFKTVQAGTAQLQNALTASSINATSVAALTGTTVSSGVTAPAVVIGVLSISGSSAVAHYDANSAGSVFTGVLGTGSFVSPFDPATGRTLIANTLFVGAVLYLYDTGKGFVIDVTPAANGGNHAFSGPLISQASPPFSTQSDLSGNFLALGGGSSKSTIPNFDMAANFDGAFSYSAMGDLTTSNTSIGTNGQVPNFAASGGFRIDDTTLGRGEMQILGGLLGDPNTFATDLVSFYLIGPNQFVAIGETSGVASGVLFFDPQ